MAAAGSTHIDRTPKRSPGQDASFVSILAGRLRFKAPTIGRGDLPIDAFVVIHPGHWSGLW
jgi:hypothetical protein